jgi:hypothetical protein
VHRGDGDERAPAEPATAKRTALEERNALLEQALPEHEKAVVVRVPSAAAHFSAKLPQERWIGVAWLIVTLYVGAQIAIYSLPMAMAGMAWLCPAAALPWGLALLLSLRKVLVRPELSLSEGGLTIRVASLVSTRRTIAIDALRGFTMKLVRRKFDNAESWHLSAQLTDGRSVYLGKTRTANEAAELLSGLETTLALLRSGKHNYRVSM